MSVLKIIKKIKESDREVRILILGLDNAGKTTLLKRLLDEDVNEVSPTVGFNIKTIDYKGEYTITFWDIGGQSSIRSYWSNYYAQTDGIIWVLDSTDVARIGECASTLDHILQQEQLAGASVLIFANKQDVEGAMSQRAIQQYLHLEESINRHWFIASCSAKTGDGVADGFDLLVQDIASRVFLR